MYRYELHRTVGFDVGRLVWVMLNPSTADESVDDPTIRRVKQFTADHGYGDLVVVNLFAARATNPRDLLSMDNPVGEGNTYWISRWIAEADDTIFAWGSTVSQPWLRKLADPMIRFCQEQVRHPFCLGTTKDGSPRHPLYVPASQPLELFDVHVRSCADPLGRTPRG